MQKRGRTPRQSGAALVVVLALMLLGSLVLLASTRRAWLNDRFVGAEADQQRAFAAAEALIRDAELDIQGLRADGTACPANPAAPSCRSPSNGMGFFPLEDSDLDALTTLLGSADPPCIHGLCLPSDLQTVPVKLGKAKGLAAMQKVGAAYGQFTGASAKDAGNPLLISSPQQAWYWVEVLRYSSSSAIRTGTQGMPVPDPLQPYVYRINAVVQGLKPGTQVYLSSVLVPRPLR